MGHARGNPDRTLRRGDPHPSLGRRRHHAARRIDELAARMHMGRVHYAVGEVQSQRYDRGIIIVEELRVRQGGLDRERSGTWPAGRGLAISRHWLSG
jgi:hypothetical protein